MLRHKLEPDDLFHGPIGFVHDGGGEYRRLEQYDDALASHRRFRHRSVLGRYQTIIAVSLLYILGYADHNLIAKWKKLGYERLCCLRCMQPRDHNFQTTCVCRVPKRLREEKVVECVHCGCGGYASGD
ncbi:G10 family protein [Striga hermonthica]|uniref:G10 family protein n=1 Tax=Striga hermonthica TaxID=68872 RepID=A0A9N7N037_STRHE|nr:G10 family protein [Striga hermonthica]